MTIRVLLVDDQTMVRVGFRMILEAEDDVEVVGEAEDGDQGVALTGRFLPDIVLMDVQMPRLDGLEATRRIVADPRLSSRVVMLTTFERDDYIFEALQAGASGSSSRTHHPRSSFGRSGSWLRARPCWRHR